MTTKKYILFNEREMVLMRMLKIIRVGNEYSLRVEYYTFLQQYHADYTVI